MRTTQTSGVTANVRPVISSAIWASGTYTGGAGLLRQTETVANVSDDPDDAARGFLERGSKPPSEEQALAERIAGGPEPPRQGLVDDDHVL